MIKKTFLAIGVSLTLATVIYQAAFAQGVILEAKSASTSTMSQDELCTMTNGNRIPCAFLEAAEKDIAAEGKVVDRVSGVEYCQTEDGLVPCASIKSDGSTAFAYKLQQYINVVMIFLLQYGLHLALGVGLLIGFVVARKKLAK